MNIPNSKMWDDRYSSPEFAYGTNPNVFLKEQLQKIKPCAILFPAEGEGRNAVYAATQGFTVSASDISNEGKNKAIKLAQTNNVTIDYQVGELQNLNFMPNQFDALALIYAHFPAHIKSNYHKTLVQFLKPGGTLIFEAFSKSHLSYNTANNKVGGPKDLDMLFSVEELKADFTNFEFIELEETIIELNEGLYHVGTGSVIRCVAKKK